jgi:hypothetical protein
LVRGRIFAMVSPCIWGTCMGRLDIIASLREFRSSVTPTP